jgi:nucleosome assembly protein 1-like 1
MRALTTRDSQIIPRAIDFFTGKALEYENEDDFDEEDFDEEDEFDEDDVSLDAGSCLVIY